MKWNLKIAEFELNINPNFEDQEFNAIQSTGNTYWEGGIHAIGKQGGKDTSGNGYLELK